MEIIKAITECEKDYMCGYKIITDAQEILLLIDDGQQCCERSGYFMSEDNLSDFIEAQFLGLELTDTALSEAKMKKNKLEPSNEYFEGGIMFVDIKTNKGVLQFVAYNEHNGYYGHKARVVSTNLEHTEVL